MVMNSKFSGTCKACNGWFPSGTQIDWLKGWGARHVQCPPVPAKVEPMNVNLQPIIDFIGRAKAHLKFPKAHFLGLANEEMKLYIAGPRSKAPGSLQILVREQWVGRVEPDGTVRGMLREDKPLQDLLLRIASDPQHYASEYGRITCRCSFCGLKLEDEGSVEVGYGPVCAKHYGLPHKPLGRKTMNPLA